MNAFLKTMVFSCGGSLSPSETTKCNETWMLELHAGQQGTNFIESKSQVVKERLNDIPI